MYIKTATIVIIVVAVFTTVLTVDRAIYKTQQAEIQVKRLQEKLVKACSHIDEDAEVCSTPLIRRKPHG